MPRQVRGPHEAGLGEVVCDKNGRWWGKDWAGRISQLVGIAGSYVRTIGVGREGKIVIPSAGGTHPDILLDTDSLSEGSDNLYYTDERAQDAIGGMIADTTTIDLTYTDATPELKADVIKQMSVTSDASGLKLDGDAASPGNNKAYSTNGSGTKGWNVPDHGSIDGLTDDDHTGHPWLIGRSGGQSLSGGTDANDDLTLQGTTNATRTPRRDFILFLPVGENILMITGYPI